jgi:hypothetical protein
MYSISTRTARPSDCTAVVPSIDPDFWTNRAQTLWAQAADWDEVVTGLWSRRDAVVFALAHEMKEVSAPDGPLAVVDLLALAEEFVLAL